MEDSCCLELHRIFNMMPRLSWTDIGTLPFNNGIYIVFEEGERLYGMDRIVRVGTHNANGNLLIRLRNHFIRENKDGSIFRKNIGRAILHNENDPFEWVWELNTSNPQVREAHADSMDFEYQRQIENRVTDYMRNKFSFVCFPVETKQDRLRLEEGILTTLNQETSFKSSDNWFGLKSPIECIVLSGLWNSQGLNGTPLTHDELESIINITIGSDRQVTPQQDENKKKLNNVNVKKVFETNPLRTSTNDIRTYIKAKLQTAKENGLEFQDVVSGDIHREMQLSNKMPSVCSAMYQLKNPADEVLHATPSGKSSTIKIRYFLNER